MVDPKKIQRFIDDYNEVFQTDVDRFICPITLRECDPGELIEGHILNAALTKASRRTVVQFDKIDGFYGTRVEPAVVEFLNMKDKERHELLLQAGEWVAIFHDGSNARAFSAGSTSGKKARGKYPICTLSAGVAELPVYICVAHDDERLSRPINIRASRSFMPAHWVAAMLKTAMLAMFDMIGYRAIYSPTAEALRNTLCAYYKANGSADDAVEHFRDFHNSVKIFGTGTDPASFIENYKPISFDTLDDQIVLLHCTANKSAFAASCLFQVNDITVSVTIPADFSNDNAVNAWRNYALLMNADPELQQSVHRAQYDGAKWKFEERPLNVQYLSGSNHDGDLGSLT